MTLKETIARLFGSSTPANGGTPASAARDNGTGAAGADQSDAPHPEKTPATDAAASVDDEADDATTPDTNSGE